MATRERGARCPFRSVALPDSPGVDSCRGSPSLVGPQGPFDMADCTSRHSINPYSNRESRVLFSTWNLDHM